MLHRKSKQMQHTYSKAWTRLCPVTCQIEESLVVGYITPEYKFSCCHSPHDLSGILALECGLRIGGTRLQNVGYKFQLCSLQHNFLAVSQTLQGIYLVVVSCALGCKLRNGKMSSWNAGQVVAVHVLQCAYSAGSEAMADQLWVLDVCYRTQFSCSGKHAPDCKLIISGKWVQEFKLQHQTCTRVQTYVLSISAQERGLEVVGHGHQSWHVCSRMQTQQWMLTQPTV